MKRWPGIRHVRYFWLKYRVMQHYALWRSLGYLPVHIGHDIEALEDVWRGER